MAKAIRPISRALCKKLCSALDAMSGFRHVLLNPGDEEPDAFDIKFIVKYQNRVFVVEESMDTENSLMRYIQPLEQVGFLYDKELNASIPAIELTGFRLVRHNDLSAETPKDSFSQVNRKWLGLTFNPATATS